MILLKTKITMWSLLNMIRIYELSLGHNTKTDMTTILDHKTNTVIAEFDEYNMAKNVLN